LGVVGLTLPQPMGLVDMYIISRPLLGSSRGDYVGPMVFKSQVDADLFGPGTLQPFSSTTISNRLKQLHGFHSEVCRDRFIISKAAGCGLVGKKSASITLISIPALLQLVKGLGCSVGIVGAVEQLNRDRFILIRTSRAAAVPWGGAARARAAAAALAPAPLAPPAPPAATPPPPPQQQEQVQVEGGLEGGEEVS